MSPRETGGFFLKDVIQVGFYIVTAIALFIGFRATTQGHIVNAAIHLDESQAIIVSKSADFLNQDPIGRLVVLETKLIAFEDIQIRNGEKLDQILIKLTE